MRFLLLLFLLSCNNLGDDKTTSTNNTDSSTVKKGLTALSWINGNWKGLYEGKPFYENYTVLSDSILQIISYELEGSDTSKSLVNNVYWKDGYYYLGDSLNWKVTSLTDREIHMEPNYKANNDITWTYQDSVTWIAVLKSASATSTYVMERQLPLDSILKNKKK
jgi:hypothetical protein